MKRSLDLTVLLCAAALATVAACKVYPNWDGEFSAGPADPVTFPPPYLGQGGNPAKPALGTFTEIAALSQGQPVGYYSFPFAPSVLPAPAKNPPDPLALKIGDLDYGPMPAPVAYVFDPKPGKNPFPQSPGCSPPPGYEPDARLDDVSYNDQGNIFTVPPSATYSLSKAATWTYEPIVKEVQVTADGAYCQGFKSEASLPADVTGSSPDGYFLAWPIIDPGAPVFRVGQNINNSNGITVQHFGWYNHYLVAYLDGGYIPTSLDVAGDGTTQVLHMVTQTLYYPRSKIILKDPMNPVNGAIGQGYDVLDAARGSDGYSPVCAVMTYDVGMAVTVDKLPQDSDTIKTMYGTTLQADRTPYIYCLQAQ